MKALATGSLWLLVVTTMTFTLWTWMAQRDLGVAANLQRARVNELRGMVEHLRQQRVVRDPDGLVEQVAQCEAKLADVRHVLEVLIRTEQATGRRRWSLEALPRPVSDWPSWPCRGAAIGSITERSHPCDPPSRATASHASRGATKPPGKPLPGPEPKTARHGHPVAPGDSELSVTPGPDLPVGGAR